MDYLSEAFKQLEILNEDVFDLDKDGLEDLKDFQDETEEEVIDVIDPDAENEEELEDSYIGKVILDCSVCHTDIYKDKEDVIIDEETQLANVGEECPYCFSIDGFKVIGEVKPFVETEFETEDDVEVEVDGEEVEEEDEEEEKNESLKRKKRMVEAVSKRRNRKSLTEAPIYGLEPRYDARKSFYGKAQVDTGDKGDKNKLYSYGTLVAEIKDGKPVVYGTYSQTTLRHIKDWLKQNGFKAETSRQILADYGVKDESCNEKKPIRESSGEVFHNDNGKEYTVVERSRSGKNALLNRGGQWIIAWNCPKDSGSWGQGHYFFDEDEAREWWDKKYIKESKSPMKISKRPIKESCSINQCQKWIDYDMKKYKRISDDTMEKIKSSGYSVVKDQYGDYEVIADRKDTSKNEACGEKRKSRKMKESKVPMKMSRKSLKEGWNTKDVERFLKGAVKDIMDEKGTCATMKLDNRLAVCVGWSDGYYDDDVSVIHAKNDPEWGMNAGIKVWTSDSMRTDFDFINAPYNEDTGDVWDTSVSISPDEDYASLASYFEKEYDEMKEYEIDKDGKIVGKWSDEDEEFEESCGNRKSRKIKESIEDIKIDTGDQEISVSAKDKEEVKSDDEMIAPLSDEVKTDIEMNTDEEENGEEVDVDMDEFSEEEFDDLGESYLKKVYENVDSYKTTSVSEKGNKLKVEGLIKFTSGKTKKTSFVFEAKTIDKNGHAKFLGENLQISRGHKSFKLSGTVSNNKFIAESLNYNYRAKNGKSSQRVYGTVKVNKK